MQILQTKKNGDCTFYDYANRPYTAHWAQRKPYFCIFVAQQKELFSRFKNLEYFCTILLTLRIWALRTTVAIFCLFVFLFVFCLFFCFFYGLYIYMSGFMKTVLKSLHQNSGHVFRKCTYRESYRECCLPRVLSLNTVHTMPIQDRLNLCDFT